MNFHLVQHTFILHKGIILCPFHYPFLSLFSFTFSVTKKALMKLEEFVDLLLLQISTVIIIHLSKVNTPPSPQDAEISSSPPATPNEISGRK